METTFVINRKKMLVVGLNSAAFLLGVRQVVGSFEIVFAAHNFR